MRSFIFKAPLIALLVAFLAAFSPKPGGEGFEIFLNSKVLLQQFGKDINNVKKIEMGQVSAGDKLVVQYYHCGQAGKNRIISLRTENGKLVKQYKYPDGKTSVTGMSIDAAELASALSKLGNTPVLISYTAYGLSNEKQLATLSYNSKMVAATAR